MDFGKLEFHKYILLSQHEAEIKRVFYFLGWNSWKLLIVAIANHSTYLAISRGTSILGEVRHVWIWGVTQQLIEIFNIPQV